MTLRQIYVGPDSGLLNVKLEYKPQFFDDLDDIAEYIKSNFSGELAQSVVQDIYNECRALADTPNRGIVYSRNTYFKYLIIKKNIRIYIHPKINP